MSAAARHGTIDEAIFMDVEGFHEHGYCKVASNVSLYYALFGNGPVKVVLLMGIATSGLAWKNQIEYLVSFPQYQVCIIDNRGSGKTVTPSGRITTTWMAQDVNVLLQHLGWDKIHLVGNSLGGMISQELALIIPEKLLSLTLIATHAGGWWSYVPPWQMFSSFLRHPFGKGTREQLRSLMGLVFSEKFLDLPGKKENFSIINGEYSTILDFYLDLIGQFDEVFVKENPIQMFLKQLSAVFTHNVTPKRLSVLKDKFPILCIVGTGDKIIHPSHTDKLHSALGGHLLKFEGAGHAVTEECLDAVNSALHKHFSQVPCL
jgi:pimeloyl-ACP methyl ester carboxylesterase